MVCDKQPEELYITQGHIFRKPVTVDTLSRLNVGLIPNIYATKTAHIIMMPTDTITVLVSFVRN